MGVPLHPVGIESPSEYETRQIEAHVYSRDELQPVFTFGIWERFDDVLVNAFIDEFELSTQNESRVLWLDDLPVWRNEITFSSPSHWGFLPVRSTSDFSSGLYLSQPSSYELALRAVHQLFHPDHSEEREKDPSDTKNERRRKTQKNKIQCFSGSHSFERIISKKIEKWFIHHIKDRPVCGRRFNSPLTTVPSTS